MPRIMGLMPAASMPLSGVTRDFQGASLMPSVDCPNCDGTGYTQDASGETVICPMCDGTGVLLDDEGDANEQ
jgi:DnaJ-class molecular chaperone